jgi:hypothetical protein
MSKIRQLFGRYWSLVFACLIPFLDAYADRFPGGPIESQGQSIAAQSNVVTTLCLIYGAGATICLGLLIHSWVMQRCLTRNKWRLAFWTHILLFPALVTLMLGLHRIQTYTYDLSADFQRWGGGVWYQSLHYYAEDGAENLIWIVMLDAVLIILWAIIAVFKNKSGRPDSRPA